MAHLEKNKIRVSIAVHGGAGGSKNAEDGCQHAAQIGYEYLTKGHNALDAVVSAVIALENDGRFNAGYGSVLRLDGRTIEMDASVMDTQGRLGAVAGLKNIKNPVLAAQAVAQTPHWLLVGEGAERFALKQGLETSDQRSDKARQEHLKILQHLSNQEHARNSKPVKNSEKNLEKPDMNKEKNTARQALPQAQQTQKFDLENQEYSYQKDWNYSTPMEQVLKEYGCGTVGAVALDEQGYFAVASSTGGVAPALLGRVGDTPIIGCGFYAGAKGAIAATGVGEYIVRHLLARTVYEWLEAGMPLEAALKRGVELFPDDVDIGLIGVTREHTAYFSNRSMPAYVL